MENIKQDIEAFIDKYLSYQGGDITPIQSLQLDNAITQLALCLYVVIEQNK